MYVSGYVAADVLVSLYGGKVLQTGKLSDVQRTRRTLDKVGDTTQALDKAGDVAKQVDRVEDVVKGVDQIEDAVRGASKAKRGGNTWKDVDLLEDLAKRGVKYNPNDVLAVTKTGNGKLVWLEKGNSKAGMQHILNHADDFAKKGIQQNQIKDLVMESITNGKIVGYQGRGTGRPIYEVIFGGKTYHTAITIGDNGFIVGANPTTLP